MKGLLRKIINIVFGTRLTLWLENQLVRTYSAPNSFTRRWALAAVFWLYRLVLFVRSGLTFEILRLEGVPAGQETPVSVVYFQEGRGFDYLAGQIFGDNPFRQETLGRCRFWHLPDRARALANQADMVVVERNTLLGWLPSVGSWLRVPTWVRMVMEIDPRLPWEEVEKGLHKHANNIRRMKKAGFTIQTSREPGDFETFYERMHLPFINERHKGYGITDTREHLRSIFNRGFLTQVLSSEGEVVAADLNLRSGEVHYAVAVGVLDANKAWLDAGVLSAMYYYQIKRCHEEGIRRFDLGGARPFATNGLYQYKRRWGFQPVLDYWNPREWLIWLPDGSETARRWLIEHPFVPEFLRTGGGRIVQEAVEMSPKAAG